MSGNIILDSMKKKETIALAKLLEAMKVRSRKRARNRHKEKKRNWRD
jgi:hypothetical protein